MKLEIELDETDADALRRAMPHARLLSGAASTSPAHATLVAIYLLAGLQDRIQFLAYKETRS